MSELTDVLEVMNTSIGRWTSIHGEGWEWRHFARFRKAWLRDLPPEKRARMVGFSDDESERGEEAATWRLWVAPHDRIRTQFVVEDESITAIIVGDRWWSWSPIYGARTNDGDPHSSHGIGPGEALLNPFRLLPAMRLEVVGQRTFADRAAVDVVAVPKEHWEWPTPMHSLGSGADEYLLTVDADRGVLLRSEARIDGEPFRVLEIESISFDEDLDDELFTPGEDEKFEIVRLPREVAISELAGSVAFTVFVPEDPPFDVEDVTIHPAEGPVPETVHIAFASGFPGEEDRQFWLAETAEPLPDVRSVEWREAEGMRYGDDYNVQPPLRVVQLKRLNTYVELSAYHMAIDELLDLARSLVPLPKTL